MLDINPGALRPRISWNLALTASWASSSLIPVLSAKAVVSLAFVISHRLLDFVESPRRERDVHRVYGVRRPNTSPFALGVYLKESPKLALARDKRLIHDVVDCDRVRRFFFDRNDNEELCRDIQRMSAVDVHGPLEPVTVVVNVACESLRACVQTRF